MQDVDRKKMIQQGFDTVAQGYDHDSLFFFPETAKRLVDYLNLQADDQLLDVCTGTGVAALAAAQKMVAMNTIGADKVKSAKNKKTGKVTGIDLSTGMLQQAKNKAGDRDLNNIEFMQMDLDNLSFAEASFDIATCSFGLFFLEDMTRGLSNISHVVKPGGKIAISTFTGEAFSPMADLFIAAYEATGRVVPALSWRRLATVELIEAQFSAVGIEKVEVFHQSLGYHMTSADMWWDVVWNAGWRSLLNQLSEQEQLEFKKVHMQEITDLIGDEGVWFNTEVLIAIAQK